MSYSLKKNPLAQHNRGDSSSREYGAWLRLSAKLLFLAIFCFLIFGVFFGFQRISSIAMDPYIKDGDLALYMRYDTQYVADDRVLFSREGKSSVSTIVALPDQIINIDEDGYLLVNGEKITESPIYKLKEDMPHYSLPYRIPSDSYFILNANLNDFNDSRTFGAIPKDQIKGKIISILRTREI